MQNIPSLFAEHWSSLLKFEDVLSMSVGSIIKDFGRSAETIRCVWKIRLYINSITNKIEKSDRSLYTNGKISEHLKTTFGSVAASSNFGRWRLMISLSFVFIKCFLQAITCIVIFGIIIHNRWWRWWTISLCSRSRYTHNRLHLFKENNVKK